MGWGTRELGCVILCAYVLIEIRMVKGLDDTIHYDADWVSKLGEREKERKTKQDKTENAIL